MADISNLTGLLPVQELDLDNYADAKEAAPLPKAGVYTVQAPDSFPSSAFGATKLGNLSVQIDPTIIAPSNQGFKIRFTKVSAKQFQRSGKTASQLGDYLRAAGLREKFSTVQQQADAVEMTANRQYQVELDWRAYNKNTGFTLEGMERFPSDGSGGHLPWCEDPNATDPETGKPVRLRAQVVVKRFISAQ